MGFFLSYRIKSYGFLRWERGGGHGEHGHKTPSYDTKDTEMLLKVIYDKTAFVKLKISNNFS